MIPLSEVLNCTLATVIFEEFKRESIRLVLQTDTVQAVFQEPIAELLLPFTRRKLQNRSSRATWTVDYNF